MDRIKEAIELYKKGDEHSLARLRMLASFDATLMKRVLEYKEPVVEPVVVEEIKEVEIAPPDPPPATSTSVLTYNPEAVVATSDVVWVTAEVPPATDTVVVKPKRKVAKRKVKK